MHHRWLTADACVDDIFLFVKRWFDRTALQLVFRVGFGCCSHCGAAGFLRKYVTGLRRPTFIRLWR
jgi:hypothetical protein